MVSIGGSGARSLEELNRETAEANLAKGLAEQIREAFQRTRNLLEGPSFDLSVADTSAINTRVIRRALLLFWKGNRSFWPKVVITPGGVTVEFSRTPGF